MKSQAFPVTLPAWKDSPAISSLASTVQRAVRLWLMLVCTNALLKESDDAELSVSPACDSAVCMAMALARLVMICCVLHVAS